MTPGDKPPDGSAVTIEGLEMPAIVHSGGMTLTGTDGKMVSAKLGCVTSYIMLIAVIKWFKPTLYQQFQRTISEKRSFSGKKLKYI